MGHQNLAILKDFIMVQLNLDGFSIECPFKFVLHSHRSYS